MDVTAAARHPAVHASIARAIAKANAGVSRAESIREFRILPFDFTEANGMLTPSMKVRRQVVMEKCADAIADIYAGVSQPDLEPHSSRELTDLSKVTGYLKNLLSFPRGE